MNGGKRVKGDWPPYNTETWANCEWWKTCQTGHPITLKRGLIVNGGKRVKGDWPPYNTETWANCEWWKTWEGRLATL